MGSFFAVLQLVVRRSIGNARLLLAVIVGVVLAAALLASTAIYNDALDDLGLHYALGHRPQTKLDLQVQTSSSLTRRQDYDRGQQTITGAVRRNLGSLPRGETRVLRSATFYPSAVGQTFPPDENRPRAFFQVLTDLKAHTRLVAGEDPPASPPLSPGSAPKLAVLMGKEAADLHGLKVGDSFDLHPFWRQDAAPVNVTIGGLIEPLDYSEEYWLGYRDRFAVTTTSWPTYPF